jgi:hypothetical protein
MSKKHNTCINVPQSQTFRSHFSLYDSTRTQASQSFYYYLFKLQMGFYSVAMYYNKTQHKNNTHHTNNTPHSNKHSTQNYANNEGNTTQ